MMQNSGSKLVLGLVAIALVLGGVSWSYRYESAHRASQLWGPQASRLIAESTDFEAVVFEPCRETELAELGSAEFGRTIDLHDVRGQAHLRHAILSDRNYLWEDPHDPDATMWRLCLRFSEGDRQAFVLLSDGFETIGKYDPSTKGVVGYSCAPMTLSLTQYFGPLDAVPDDAIPDDASTAESSAAE